ncbi:MAG: hypothetical protein HKN43_08505 [Rhodothermales bacterium]|nr:hypothetical protein [Rhodothermales bacterium]
MIAILSMMIASLFAFNQHRSALSTRLGMISQDLEMRATSVAVEHLEHIGSLAYDSGTLLGAATDPSELTRLDSSYRSSGDLPGALSISDFHNSAVEVTRLKNGKAIIFDVATSITYIDGSTFEDTSTPTKIKKVTVTVGGINTDLVKPVRVSEVFACGSECNW